MNPSCYLILILTLFVKTGIYAQSQRFIVKKATFSTQIHDEFSPVYYRGGIVFCSNSGNNSLIGYTDKQDGLSKIFYVTAKEGDGWKQPGIFAKELSTDCHDGPVTFNKTGNLIYYSRNNSTEKSLRNISDTSNKLGIYSAELINGLWANIKPFIYNDALYNFTTPTLSPDGNRLYFSSDMPGGQGGMDLYYCDRRGGDWDKPINMGSVINTPENESFPFAANYGKLFFASDGHKGYGGKDLYYSREINEEWLAPVHLDSAINSPADDFGILTDSTFTNGYFSTNRQKSDDVFSFSSSAEEFTNCNKLLENNFCFTFYDEQYELIDTIPTIYQWDFGDRIIRTGREVKHCFPGPGVYTVKLSIMDELTGKAIAEHIEYTVELENIEQAYIHSANVGLVNQAISFDGTKTNLEGFRITDYLWNFGDGFKHGGPYMSHSFGKSGEYTVQLGLLGPKDSLDMIPKTCVEKKIRIHRNYEELMLKAESEAGIKSERNGAVEENAKRMQIRIIFADDLMERQRVKIGDVFNKTGIHAVASNRFGLATSSFAFLDTVAGILKENPEIRLEIVVHSVAGGAPDNSIEVSEKWAQELAFYFRGKEMGRDAVQCKGSGLSDQPFKSFKPGILSNEGVIDLIFMMN
ncbi:MAG: PKD domain-containing protein [Bacteroidales bacterium]|nr:PKD domain-containing protein [Bacteroidales bacterium]